MADWSHNKLGRRAFLATTAAALASPALAQSVNDGSTTELERNIDSSVRRNISSFRTLDWQPYF